MADRSSDPSWFPEPRPRVEKPAPIGRVIAGAVLPVAAIGGLVVVLSMNKKPAQTQTRSLAAYQACLRSHGATAGERSASQAALRACRDRRPAGTPAPSGGSQSQSAREAFAECMRDAGVGRGSYRGRGRFERTGPSEEYRNALQVCASLARGAGQPPPARTTPAQPTIPVA